MRPILHIFTDGGYNKMVDESYYGFIMYKESGNTIDILTVKTKTVKTEIDFERKALFLAYSYIANSKIVEKLNAKVVVHTEMYKNLMNEKNKYNQVKIDFEKLLKKRNVSFVYSPAHELDLFNIIIDTLISSNNIRDLVVAFGTIPKGNSIASPMCKSYIKMDTQGYINMSIILYRIRLEHRMADSKIKKEAFELTRSIYSEFFIDKIMFYRGKRLLYWSNVLRNERTSFVFFNIFIYILL